MTAERRERPGNILDLAGSGLESELTDNQESVWRDVVRRVDEVYSDLLRYEADLESKNAELEEAQSFISSVIASVSDILVVCDENGMVLQANPAFVALLGQSEPELIGRALLDFVVADDHEQARRHLVRGSARRGRRAGERLRIAFSHRARSVRCDGDQFFRPVRPFRPLRRLGPDRAADRRIAPRLSGPARRASRIAEGAAQADRAGEDGEPRPAGRGRRPRAEQSDLLRLWQRPCAGPLPQGSGRLFRRGGAARRRRRAATCGANTASIRSSPIWSR